MGRISGVSRYPRSYSVRILRKGSADSQQMEQIQQRMSREVSKEVISRDEVPKEVFPEVRRSGRVQNTPFKDPF